MTSDLEAELSCCKSKNKVVDEKLREERLQEESKETTDWRLARFQDYFSGQVEISLTPFSIKIVIITDH